MTDTTPTTPPHPARFSGPVLDQLMDLLHPEVHRIADREPGRGYVHVLDPFAGVGNVHRLAGPVRVGPEDDDTRTVLVSTVGVELEPEWATAHPGTEQGDATALRFDTGSFDVVATSPCYGNRMADHHEARDTCKTCAGTGYDGEDSPLSPSCPSCKGAGLSKRNTYRHQLGRPLTPGSGAGLLWGPEYRALHDAAIGEMVRVVREDGLVLVNMSNHLTDKGNTEHHVTEWWVNALLYRACRIAGVYPVRTRRQRQGQNGQHRTEHEFVIAVRTPRNRRLL